MQLFFVLGAVQTLPVWILADSGSLRNLIDESVFNRFPYKLPINDNGDFRVIGGNGEALDLKGFAVLPVSLGSNLIWHEFGVVPNLPLEVLVDADLLSPHLFSLSYLKNNKRRLQFGVQVCPRCAHFRNDPEAGQDKQLRFVDLRLKLKRNRLKVGYSILATLPEAISGDSDSNQIGELDDQATPSVEHDGLQLPKTVDPSHISAITPVASASLNPSISIETSKPAASTQSDKSGQLQRVLADLKVTSLPISEQLRKRLVQIVRENQDAFAASPTNLGRTSVVIHTIKTGEARPLRHKFRAIPFARRQYLLQEVERLMSVGAIFPADPGACPYASRTVVTPKKDGLMRMCVDYRDVNAQTEDSVPLLRIDQVWPTLSRARYFASLDLLMGLYQVEVDPRD